MNLSMSLANDQHDVFILHGGRRHEAYDMEHPRITFISLVHLVHPLNAVEDIKAIKEVHQWLRQLRPDVVALHSSKAGTVGRIAARALNLPTVFTAHGWSFTEGVSPKKQRVYRFIEKTLAKQTDAIIAVSHYDKNLACKAHISPKNGLYVVHNGIEGCSQQPNIKTKNIVMVARFQAPKRQDLVVKAFEMLENSDLTLTLVGDGPLREEVEQLAQDLGIAHQVHFTGDQQDVMSYLKEADVFVLMSNFEGLPIAIIEAMAVGLPIVASKVGGVGELVHDGENGFTVANKPEDLRDALAAILTDDMTRQTFGQRSREKFESAFQFKRTYAETLQIYHKVRC